MKWIFLLGFGSFGLAFFIGGIAWGIKRYALAAHGRQAVGRVVEIQESESVSTVEGRKVRSVVYYPVVEFQAADGSTHKFRGSTGSGRSAYEVGAAVTLLYMPDNPANAQIKEFTQFWLGPLGVGLFGAFFLGAGIAAFVMIGNSDKTFGPSFHNRMDRGRLFDMKQGVKTTATVRSIESVRRWGRATGRVLVCVAPGVEGAPREFRSVPLAIEPDPAVVGRSVDVYVDPFDADRYYIHLDPLFHPSTNTPEKMRD